DKVKGWFSQITQNEGAREEVTARAAQLRVGLSSEGPVSPDAAARLAMLTRLIVGAGGTVVIPETATLLSTPAFRTELLGTRPPVPTLAYGEPITTAGLHIMESPTTHWVESITGLGATGVEVILALAGEHPLQSHPLVPVLQIAGTQSIAQQYAADVDLDLRGTVPENLTAILERMSATLSRRYVPKLTQMGNIDFQLTRGLMGVSM
ncbi:MAG: hypothetical protein WDZ49_12565, partial [Litorilinea sp.]